MYDICVWDLRIELLDAAEGAGCRLNASFNDRKTVQLYSCPATYEARQGDRATPTTFTSAQNVLQRWAVHGFFIVVYADTSRS
jgi:hypothetical protein